ncbi:hypothetical protein ABZZ17_25520 [Streptomyces sp. NPDC006512]|uniref:hypothetical protein n=1 Tax=Streptomyces sp. NPDC006512 TaxID=3154307 RepID=UPI0033A68CED
MDGDLGGKRCGDGDEAVPADAYFHYDEGALHLEYRHEGESMSIVEDAPGTYTVTRSA